MFDIGWTELLVIAVVAIVVIGPKDLPRALRTLGQWTAKMKRMAQEFRSQFTEAIREAELDAVQRDLEQITALDPLGEIRQAAEKTSDDIRRDLEKTAPPPSAREPYPWEVATKPDAMPPPVSVSAEDTAPAVLPSQPTPAEQKP
jgi:sec-independent protein translocase protein TatB